MTIATACGAGYKINGDVIVFPLKFFPHFTLSPCNLEKYIFPTTEFFLRFFMRKKKAVELKRM
jgi:hypothetical protein